MAFADFSPQGHEEKSEARNPKPEGERTAYDTRCASSLSQLDEWPYQGRAHDLSWTAD